VAGIKQQIRFCASADGVRIAYAISGTGPPLISAANWLTHLEQEAQSPVWRHWLEELSRANTLVRYDKRGCGLSDRNARDLSFEACVSRPSEGTSASATPTRHRYFVLPQPHCVAKVSGNNVVTKFEK
jgi:pimeloyl-ACP methyl ester carboxylesterase